MIEASERILPALPQRLSDAATKLLEEKGVRVRTSARVAEVLPNGVPARQWRDHSGGTGRVGGGREGPGFSERTSDGLETNRTNQLVVKPTLQTTRDEEYLRPRRLRRLPMARDRCERAAARAGRAPAGLAHGRSSSERRLKGKALRPYQYRDFGSLVSLGEYTTVGNLMGAAGGREPPDRGLPRPADVHLAVQDARAGATRLHEGGTRHARAHDQQAYRAARQAALSRESRTCLAHGTARESERFLEDWQRQEECHEATTAA